MEMLVTAAEMREMDRKTIEEIRIPGLLLMEHAGMAVASRAIEMLEQIGGTRIRIFCGKGNNAGDGFVAGRLLFEQGFHVVINIIGQAKSFHGDAAINYKAIKGLGLEIVPIKSAKQISKLGCSDLIIDAIFGTGISGEVTGFIADVIDYINQSNTPVLSVDVPSGLHCDTGHFEGACIEADATVTFAQLKRGLLIPPGRELAGSVDIANIGIPDTVRQSIGVKTWLIEADDCKTQLPARPASAHKGDFGKVVVLAGSRGLTGAATLTSLAALKAGSGLVVLGCPSGLNCILESNLIEVMTHPLPETEKGSLALSGEVEIQHLLSWADILAIGPGLSQVAETQALIRKSVIESPIPVVLDADGLNAFAGHAELFSECKSPLILTPHPGELARLIHMEISEIFTDPIEIVRKWAQAWRCVLVLKGAPTVIGYPDGYVYVNSTGNSGMATAGSGDVLTGLLSGLLAQGCSIQDASLCGVYVHGMAGDIILETGSDRAMTAGDILNHIGEAFRRLEEME